jgi:hypothetical protein
LMTFSSPMMLLLLPLSKFSIPIIKLLFPETSVLRLPSMVLFTPYAWLWFPVRMLPMPVSSFRFPDRLFFMPLTAFPYPMILFVLWLFAVFEGGAFDPFVWVGVEMEIGNLFCWKGTMAIVSERAVVPKFSMSISAMIMVLVWVSPSMLYMLFHCIEYSHWVTHLIPFSSDFLFGSISCNKL